MFPERFSNLPAYAFPRLRNLLDVHSPGGPVTHMTIGEPKHAFPPWITEIIAENAHEFGKYPTNEGTPELLDAISAWLHRRYGVTLSPHQIMALNGTREGLYNAAMALCPETKNGARPVVLTPNPFYQVYAVAALSVNAEPVFVPATDATGHLPDYASLPAETWQLQSLDDASRRKRLSPPSLWPTGGNVRARRRCARPPSGGR